jgi:protein-glutamine gamma-glutamyltransferase
MVSTGQNNLTIDSIPLESVSRSTVFAVCFCFLFSIAPHFVNLPLWVSGFVLAALSWRSLENLGRLRSMPKLLLVALVLLGGIGVFAQYWTIVGRDAGLALLTVMTSFKFLESRNHRDMLILIFLCYFLIATHFLFSQSIFTALLMLLTLIIITSTLVTLNQRDDSIDIKSRFKIGLRLVALSFPFMLILFVLVPRIPGPLWGLTDEQRGGITGLSDHMSPGKISNLIRSNEVAFRVEFEGSAPPQQQLYWRGPVMALFNGKRWFQSRRPKISLFNLTIFDEPINYTVTLEPNGERWLLALDIPTRVIPDSIFTADYQLTSKLPVNDLRRYDLTSHVQYHVGLDEKPEYLELTTQYPDIGNPKTVALGQKFAREYDNEAKLVNAVLRMFREQEYVYTLQPPLLSGDTVDQFLFESFRGFCEHYSGAFALIMRAAGIPSRIVTGYQGGEFSEVGNYWIVRQSDAHAWTEVWLKDRGWIRVDPTAAVSPDRIEQGLDEALPEEISQFRISNRNPIFGNLLFGWDNLQHSWNDWVINYDDRKQKDFLKDLDIGITSWSDMILTLVFLLVTVTGIFWTYSWLVDRPAKAAKYERLLNRFLYQMSRAGFERKPSEDVRNFINRVSAEGFVSSEEATNIINLYNQIKYGRNAPTQAMINQFRNCVQSFKIN